MELFQSKDTVHGGTVCVRFRPSQTIIQWLNYSESKFVDLRIGDSGTSC